MPMPTQGHRQSCRTHQSTRRGRRGGGGRWTAAGSSAPCRGYWRRGRSRWSARPSTPPWSNGTTGRIGTALPARCASVSVLRRTGPCLKRGPTSPCTAIPSAGRCAPSECGTLGDPGGSARRLWPLACQTTSGRCSSGWRFQAFNANRPPPDTCCLRY